MENAQVELDMKMIREIDDSSVDFPYGVGDFIEDCLRQLEIGKPLTPQQRTRAKKLLLVVKKHEKRKKRNREI